jgi:hypothetical protein
MAIMESIFSVASRRGTAPEEFGRRRRDGALKSRDGAGRVRTPEARRCAKNVLD